MNKLVPAAPQRQPVTIKTIAGILGVSVSTVSRALNADPSISLKTRKSVTEAADQLGYRRDLRGVNLRTGKTFVLCALLASNVYEDVGDPAVMHLLHGLVRGLKGSDFRVVIRPVGDAQDRPHALRQVVEEGRYDGVIIDLIEPQDERVHYLLERKVPFATFGRTSFAEQHAYVDIDNEDAAYVATKHLIDKGHERIALINPPRRFMFAQQRRQGYKRAMAEAGLEVNAQLVAEMPLSASGARAEVARMFQSGASPTGFVATNEVTTLGALSAAREHAAGTFGDLHFVSRDGTRLFEYFDGAVSSCYYSMLDIGYQLTEALIGAIEGRPLASLQRVDKVSLVTR